MLNLDNDYPNNIVIWLTYMKNLKHMSPKEVTAAFNLRRWRKKHTKLVWTLVHIMNAMHVGRHPFNDISPNNIMFHFPEDESKVYIGVCDQDMTIISKDPMKSLYTFTSTNDIKDALRKRWWVDLNLHICTKEMRKCKSF